MTRNRNWIRCHGKAKLTSDCGAGQQLTMCAWQEERAAAGHGSASQLRKSLKAMARKEARAPRRREAIRDIEKEPREGKGSKENTFKKFQIKIRKRKQKKPNTNGKPNKEKAKQNNKWNAKKKQKEVSKGKIKMKDQEG